MGYQRRVHGDFSTHLYNTRLPKTIMFSLTQTAAAQSVRLTAPKRDVSRRAQAKNGGGNFSAPPRDDSETFSNSLAGQSNWNAYEGSAEKALTPEELKAITRRKTPKPPRAKPPPSRRTKNTPRRTAP